MFRVNHVNAESYEMPKYLTICHSQSVEKKGPYSHGKKVIKEYQNNFT